jgi:predicted protein tyrosine phosphatase
MYHHIPLSFKGKLYLSSVSGLNYIDYLNIDYIVSLFPPLQNQTIKEHIEHDKISIADRGDFETIVKMNSTLDIIGRKIKNNLLNGKNVLVHCFAGISRSATVVADIICKYETSVIDPYNKVNSSIEYIKMFRPQVEPNIGFIKLLNVRNPSVKL